VKKTEFQPEIMTVSSVAHYLQCHPSTTYRLLKERKIPAFKLGSDWRFQRAEIDQLDPEEAGTPAAEVTMSPRKGKRGTGRRATLSALSPGADIEMMTLRQVAQYLNCSYATAHKLAQRGEIPSFRLGGSWRFLKSEIDKWIAKGGGRK
jgi:excisionase family DNA binding protein